MNERVDDDELSLLPHSLRNREKMPFHHVTAGLLYKGNYLNRSLSAGSDSEQLANISVEELDGKEQPGGSVPAFLMPFWITGKSAWGGDHWEAILLIVKLRVPLIGS